MEIQVIMRALALLATLGINDVPLALVEVVDKPHKSVSPGAVAYAFEDEILRGEPKIYVVSSSAAYRYASRGDARVLAAALGHERCHILQGSPPFYQGPCYEEELWILEALGMKGTPPALWVRRSWELYKYDRPK